MTNTGWQCPLCNAIMSPSYPTCWYCKPVEIKTENTLKLCPHGLPVKFNNCSLCMEKPCIHGKLFYCHQCLDLIPEETRKLAEGAIAK